MPGTVRLELYNMPLAEALAILAIDADFLTGLGVSAADVADIVRASHRPQGPGGAIPSGGQTQVTGVHPHGGPVNVPGGGTGWGYSPPLSNPPGTGPGSAADRIVDEFDRRDRAELIERDAKMKAMQQMAERK